MRERNCFNSAEQAGFQKGLTTLDHVLSLRALIEEGRAHNKKIYCCFVEFEKALNMQWGIYALYESKLRKLKFPLLEAVARTIGAKQLFSL